MSILIKYPIKLLESIEYAQFVKFEKKKMNLKKKRNLREVRWVIEEIG